MKKQITALLALLMTASCFAACGETVDTGVPTDGTNDTAVVTHLDFHIGKLLFLARREGERGRGKQSQNKNKR